MTETETIEYRGILRGTAGSSMVTCSGWDTNGNLVTFGADYRMVKDLPAGVEVEVSSWAILSRAPAFEAVEL